MKRQVIGDGTMPERTGRGTRRQGCGYLFSVFDGTLSGFRFNGPPTQGSSFLATLGWRTQSLWDWEGAKHIQRRKGRGFVRYALSLICFAMGLAGAGPAHAAGSSLEKGFLHPPDSARPWVFWFWLNGNINSNAISADLEALKRAGIGGVAIMDVDQGAPKGPVEFGTAAWEIGRASCRERV